MRMAEMTYGGYSAVMLKWQYVNDGWRNVRQI